MEYILWYVIRFNDIHEIRNYMFEYQHAAYGEVCYAESGNVYFRDASLQPDYSSIVPNGTEFIFRGTYDGYAFVQLRNSGRTGYITPNYTCGYWR